MSNVYKRPMFRRGGSTNMNGIMDGIKDRQDYNVGGGAGMAADNIRLSDLAFMKREMPSVPDEVRSAPSIRNDSEPSYEEKVRKIMEDYESKRVNPIYKLLTQGGLRGMSERGGGSVAANLAKAFEGPTDQLFKDLDAKRAMERDIELKIADVAEQKNRRLQEQGFELDKLTLQQDIKAGKYDADIAILMEGGMSRPEALKSIQDRYFKKYSLGDSPEEIAREKKEKDVSDLITQNKELDGSGTFDIYTAPAYIDERNKLPENTKIHEKKKIIDPDADIKIDDVGNLILSDPKDAVEYKPGFAYFEIDSKKFYIFNGTSFIPLATE